MARFVSVRDEDIKTTVFDYSVPHRSRPNFGHVNYKELRSGYIEVQGKRVPTVPLSSLERAREIAQALKEWVAEGRLLVQEPVQRLPENQVSRPLEVVGLEEIANG